MASALALILRPKCRFDLLLVLTVQPQRQEQDRSFCPTPVTNNPPTDGDVRGRGEKRCIIGFGHVLAVTCEEALELKQSVTGTRRE